MRTTIFELDGDRVSPRVREAPPWQPFEEYEGKPLERVRLWDIAEPKGGLLQLVEIQAGGHFAMHSSPDVAFCQIVRGRGRLGLPDGRELAYEGPELFVFLPGTLHDWHAVEEDTLLSVCLVRQTP
jgi:quercetin dioxygenase-like cupin family protein